MAPCDAVKTFVMAARSSQTYHSCQFPGVSAEAMVVVGASRSNVGG